MGGPETLVFHRGAKAATELAPLVDGRNSIRPPIDPVGLVAWLLRWMPTDPKRTLYEGVTVERIEDSRAPDAPGPGRATTLEEAPAFLRRALETAVDTALAGVRRAAVLTGGGLDSSVMLGLAMRWAQRTGGSAFAVSLDFEGSGDDRPHLRALEAHLGCEVIRVRPEDAASRIALLATGIDAAPTASATMPLEVELLSRARANGAERALSGAGADELFGGQPQSLADVASRGHPFRALRSARRLEGFGRPAIPAWSWILRPLIGRAQPRALRSWRARRAPFYKTPGWAGPVVRSFVEEQRRFASTRSRLPPRTSDERLAAIEEDHHRVYLAWSRRQDEHASGLDCWDPYLDLGLASAVASLPPDYLLYGDRWRGLLRAAASDLLPPSLRDRMDKAAFERALQRFLDAAGGIESMRAFASGRELAALGLVESRALEAAFEGFVRTPGDGRAWVGLWSALAIEAFLRGRRH